MQIIISKTTIFLVGVFLTILLISCESNTEPKTPPVQLPPGYQEDIPWPSLADSPCPILYNSPQNINRFTENGPTSCILNWTNDTLDIHTGLVVGADNTIYVASQPFFLAIEPNGKVKWKLKLGVYTTTTPILTSGNEIIVYYQSPSAIYSISLDGKILWELPLDFNISSQFNIGKNGDLYFINRNTLYSVRNGEILWSFFDERIGTHISISPDSKFLYTVGTESSIVAINLEDLHIAWSIGKGTSFSAPLVDSDGNIYFSSIIDSVNNNKPALFSVTSNSKVRWFFTHYEYIDYGYKILFDSPQPAIDQFGNIYFGSDTVYSISRKGELNWKFVPDKPVGTSFILDSQRNLFLVKDYGSSFGLTILSSEGIPIIDVPSNKYAGNSSKYSGIIFDGNLVIPTQDKYLYSFK